jgi:hypothetical protein
MERLFILTLHNQLDAMFSKRKTLKPAIKENSDLAMISLETKDFEAKELVKNLAQQYNFSYSQNGNFVKVIFFAPLNNN